MSAPKESHLCREMNERNEYYSSFFPHIEKASVEKMFGKWRCGGPEVVVGILGILYCPFCGMKLPQVLSPTA